MASLQRFNLGEDDVLLLPTLLLQASIPVAAADEPPPDEPVQEAEEAEPVRASTYTLDPSAGLIYVRTHKEGIAAALAHDHAIKATGWSGTVTWHPEDASQCEVSISVPVSGLLVDDTGVRQVVGVEGEVDADQREDIRENMLGSDQLDGSSFPVISFEASSCSGTSGRVEVTGTMSIRGHSAQLTVPMDVSADGEHFAARGSFTTSHSALGLTPFSAAFGAIANGDRLDFGVDVQGTAQ